MRKNLILSIAAVSMLTAISASAGAADLEKYDVLLKASVPSDSFHVRPVESGWIGEPQEMVYDQGTSKLQPVSKMFQYKNTAGAIKATLLNTDADGAPLLFNGNQSIKLAVKFNDIAVDNKGVDVVSATDAKSGGRANLDISTASAEKLDQSKYAGEYTGSVTINFEPSVSKPTSP